VSPDPEPHEPVRSFNGHGTVAKSDTDRPVVADLLEMQRRMVRI